MKSLKRSLHEIDSEIESRIIRAIAESLDIEEDEVTNDKDIVNDLFAKFTNKKAGGDSFLL